MELHGWIRCPNCDKLITQEEALHNTIIFEGQELKLCSECRGKYVDRTVRGEGNLPVQEERDLDVGERPRKRMFDPRREDYGRY